MQAAVAHLAWLYRHPFTRGRRISAAATWIQWQVASRLFGARSIAWVDGLRLTARPGLHGATANVGLGLAEPDCMGFLLHYLRPGDLFVDVGANAGSYTLLAASRGARVVAAEPNPLPRGFLEASLQLNHLAATVTTLAVSAAPGEVAMDLVGDATGHVTADGPYRARATTLDLLTGGAPAIVKVDVEGHEEAVIEGGISTLMHAPVLIMETWGKPEIHQRLAALGLQPVSYDPANRALAPRSDFTGAQSVIFVRHIGDAAQRALAARPFTLGSRRY